MGSLAELAIDDSIALRIHFPTAALRRRRTCNFRGPVLSRYDGREWRAAEPWTDRARRQN